MDDGTRTHDDRDHNPGLYQLSYAHHGKRIVGGFCHRCTTRKLARPAGLEPATLGLAYQLLLSQPQANPEFVVWTISSPSQAPHV